MGILFVMSDILPIERVVMSVAAIGRSCRALDGLKLGIAPTRIFTFE